MALAHNPSIITSGLVLCLDAANTQSYPGTGTTWFDLSGNGNHLTALNSPTFNTSGFFNTGTGDNGYFNRASSTNIPTANQQYTMQSWIRFPSIWQNAAGIISIGSFGTNNQSNALRTANSGVGEFIHYWWANDLSTSGTNAAGLSAGRWFLATALFDGTNRRIFANTSLIASDLPGASVHNVTSSAINLMVSNATEFLRGDMSAAIIYNRALSTDEIQQNFNAYRGRYSV